MQEVANNACIIWLLATVLIMSSPHVIQIEYKTDTNATQPATINEVEVIEVLEGMASGEAFIFAVKDLIAADVIWIGA